MTYTEHCKRALTTTSQPLVAALALAILPFIAISQPMQAQTLTVLHQFAGGADGAAPEAGLLRDSKGNLYGTTTYGGAACSDPRGCGTLFEISRAGNIETVLHAFAGATDGVYPLSDLTEDEPGNIYGTTSNEGPSGGGTVFQLNQKHKLTTIHSFGGSFDGSSPQAGPYYLHPFLFGTTYEGGAYGLGTTYAMNTAGEELNGYEHSFQGSPDGASPESPLWLCCGEGAQLYGTTLSGGLSNEGTVFQFTGTGDVFVEYSFDGLNPGAATPFAGVTTRSGFLTGVTPTGGAYGRGQAYIVNENGGGFRTLYSFLGSPDGETPYGGLVVDKAGNTYGTTYGGGAYDLGTVFKIDSKGKETVIWSFTGGSDGAYPYGRLIIDSLGNLYGTTTGGVGENFCNPGCGSVFEIIF